jgi:NAD(P)-dependent dehydrogenase (short-subunit alcohol dehydrogenase family)
MDLQLSGKTALVTGASSVGIGRVIAGGLAEEGVRVAITARRAHLLEEVAQQIKSRGLIEPVVLPADLYQPDAPAQLARADPDGKQRMNAEGALPVGNTPEQFAAYMRSEAEKWAKVVKQSGATAE